MTTPLETMPPPFSFQTKPNGPVDKFGRDFKSYLNANPDENRRFGTAWSVGNADVLMQVVQRFFDGLIDFKPNLSGANREDSSRFSNTGVFYSQRQIAPFSLHAGH